MNPMNALNIMFDASSQARLTLADHQMVIQAREVLLKAITPTEVVPPELKIVKQEVPTPEVKKD